MVSGISQPEKVCPSGTVYSGAETAALPQKLINKGRFTVVNMRNDRNVANLFVHNITVTASAAAKASFQLFLIFKCSLSPKISAQQSVFLFIFPIFHNLLFYNLFCGTARGLNIISSRFLLLHNRAATKRARKLADTQSISTLYSFS